MKKSIPPSTGFNPLLDFVIATMKVRCTFLERLFTHNYIPFQDDIRVAAKAELEALKAKATFRLQDQTNGASQISFRLFPSASPSIYKRHFKYLGSRLALKSRLKYGATILTP